MSGNFRGFVWDFCGQLLVTEDTSEGLKESEKYSYSFK